MVCVHVCICTESVGAYYRTLCGRRKVYQGGLCVRELRCILCMNAQECKMKGCHYVANFSVWFFSCYLNVLSLEVIHISAYKILMCLLIVEGLRSDGKCCAKRWVQGLEAHLKPPGLSGFTSHFCLCCTFYFSSPAFPGVDVLACGYDCCPGARVVQTLNSPITLSLGVLSSW